MNDASVFVYAGTEVSRSAALFEDPAVLDEYARTSFTYSVMAGHDVQAFLNYLQTSLRNQYQKSIRVLGLFDVASFDEDGMPLGPGQRALRVRIQAEVPYTTTVTTQ